jgi:acyl dehydratase
MTANDPAATRIAEDDHGPRALFEDIEEGKDLGVIEWTITEADVEKQCAIDHDYHPWYFRDSPFGGRIAPPQIQYRPPRWLLSRNYNVRGVFYKWEFENTGPLVVGATVHVSGRISKKWIERDREYVSFESTGTDSKGAVVFRTTRTHVLDMVKRTAPRAGRGVDSGIKKEKI